MAPATSLEWKTPQLNHAVIALFFVKSKPRSLSVRGKQLRSPIREGTLMESPAFILTLRDYLREGRRADVHGNDEQFLDSVAFWRDAHQKLQEKSQEVEQQLRAKIRVLEQRLETISGTSGQTTQSTGTSQRKRKRENSPSKTRSGRRATKLVKTTEATAAPQSNDVQPILIDHDLAFDEKGTELIDCFLRIAENQQAISNTANNCTNQIDQANLAIQSAADARRVLLSIQTHTTQSASPHKARTTTTRIQQQQAAHTHAEVVNTAETKCNVIIQLFPFLLRTLDTLHEPSDRNQVIYCIINLFQSLLEHICNLSACEGLQKLATAVSGEETGKANGRLLTETTGFLPAPSAASKSVTARLEDKIIKMLCQLAVAMMNDLDASTPARQEVFDGFLFFLLLRVGDLLKVFTFGVESQNSAKGVHPGDMLAFHEAQAPYVIFLLRHASSLASQKSKIHRNSQKTGNAGSDPQEDAGKFEDISRIARKRLQHTLLKGVFGEQADEFMESLRRPIYSSTECELDFEEQRKRRKGCDMSKWFQNEVWETVGWDVLEEMVAWT